MLADLIGGFITILVGVTLVPVIADQIHAARYENGNNVTNITGASSTLLSLTTLFFVIAVMGTGVGVAARGLKAAGLLGV